MPVGKNRASDDIGVGWRDIVIFIVGVAAIILLVELLVPYYGKTGETSAAGVLGIVIPVIGAIASGALGLSLGTASGKSGGKSIVRDKEEAIAKMVPKLDSLLTTVVSPTHLRPARRVPGEEAPAADVRFEAASGKPTVTPEEHDAAVCSQITGIMEGLKALAPHVSIPRSE